MADINLTQLSRLPTLRATLRDYNGIINLNDASAVTLSMMNSGGVSVIANAACTIVSPGTLGQVTYAWAANDVATAGTFLAKFKVTIGGLTLPVPSDRYLVVVIAEDPA